MKALQKIENFIFNTPLWKLILIVFAIMFFKTGIWYMPNIGAAQLMAQNPFINPFPDPNQQYVFWNWLGPFLAWVIGIKNFWPTVLFHFVFSVAFSLLFLKVVFSRFSDEVARSSFILFSILPVSATAYFWVGMDSLTLFILLFALAYPRYAIVTFFSGIALGMQHFEQGFFAAGGLLFGLLLTKKYKTEIDYSLKFCFALFIGVIVGKLILMGLFNYLNIHLHSERIDFVGKNTYVMLKQFFLHFHYIVWSVLGLGWLMVLKYIELGRKAIPFSVTLFGLCLLLAVCLDQTRVVAIITFPLIAVFCLLNESFLKNISRKEVSLLFLIWILMPWVWVWEGIPRWSVFPYDIVYVLHKLFGWFSVPVNPATWPFFP